MDIRFILAIGAARVGGAISRRLRVGGGTSLPGLIALRIDPQVVSKLSKRLRGSTVITGTNGKTTTANMLAVILEEAGSAAIHNAAGANLASGIVTSIIDGTGSGGRDHFGLFEIDEATIPKVTGELRPRTVTVTNIFRDQLDRYGELDITASLIKKSLSFLDSDATAVLNSDDPRVASLADGLDVKTLFFGIDDANQGSDNIDQAKDSNDCLVCGTTLDYELHYFAHLGRYRCPGCGLVRPAPQIRALKINLAIAGTHLTIETPDGDFDLNLKLPGLYNVYNALAAVATAYSLGIGSDVIKTALERFRPTFGRLEEIKVGEKSVKLMLIKNPTGFNQIIDTLNLDPSPKNLLIAINDNIADGTDVSWLWDADIERLGESGFIIASGVRAADMAVRLKYAGVDQGKIIVESSMEAAIDEGLKRIDAGETLYILPTYTALLSLRALLMRRSDIRSFWEGSKG